MIHVALGSLVGPPSMLIESPKAVQIPALLRRLVETADSGGDIDREGSMASPQQ